MATKILNKIKEIDYNKVGTILGMVTLDTLFAVVVFYVMYYLFSIPNVWIALVALTSFFARSEMVDYFRK
jgi:ABC-type bacteriocin/lantibiotic exporter with double-glycine peptidase domain